jgi:hypothetical protein
MSIENRNLTPGAVLVGRYHKAEFRCTVIQGEGDKVRYQLSDGREFKSPSAAGMAITGHACDGWIFWSIETTPTPAAPEAETASTQTDAAAAITGVPGHTTGAPRQASEGEVTEQKPENKWPEMPKPQFPAGSNPIGRCPNQRGVPEGQIRWYCHECRKSFIAAKGQMPKACPQGHQAS